MVSSTPAQPLSLPLRQGSQEPTTWPLDLPPSLSPQVSVGKAAPFLRDPPQPTHLLCPWRQGVEVREGSASAALELWLRTGWTCWRFPWFLSAGTLVRCGVRLGGLSNTRAPRGEDSSHHPMPPFCSLPRNLRRAPTPPSRTKTPKVPVGASGKVDRLFWRGPHGSAHPSRDICHSKTHHHKAASGPVRNCFNSSGGFTAGLLTRAAGALVRSEVLP